MLGADGRRALITTYDTTGSASLVIDTTSGAQIGTAVTLSGSPSGSPVATAEGSRVYVTTYVQDPTTGFTTRVAVIDTDNGNQVGTQSP